ncbi:hypothetical protein V8G54_011082 [Vigna mungo]|uniref:Uncharacterized protein n=1 Tax=Vigna mungo TaxID=3915 RepID=A0AAQ3S2L6_VIGMU
MQINIRKWNRSRKFNPHHHHSCDPKEQYIMPSFKHCGRIESLKILCTCSWPSKGTKRPKCARKPSIKNIRILIYLYILPIFLASFLKCFISISSNHILLFIVFSSNVPYRYPVSPP